VERNEMSSKHIFLIFGVVGFLLFSTTAEAHCPLCTAAVGAGAAAAKYYGVDESIIGLFIGAFGISIGLWIARSIKKEYFKYQSVAIILLSFILTVVPLLALSKDVIYVPVFLFGSVGTMLNKVYWINKMLLGSIIGGGASIFAFGIHEHIKKKNGRVLFPYQGIAFTAAVLAVAAAALYLIFR